MNVNLIMITSILAMIIIAFPTLGRSGPLRLSPNSNTVKNKNSNLAIPNAFVCRHYRYSAALKGPDDKYYFFKDIRVFIISKNEIRNFHRREVFPSSPYDLDAMVYSPRTGVAYLFKDRFVWRYKYDGGQFVFLQKKRLGRTVPNIIEAAFNYQEQIYLLKNGYLYVWDEPTNTVLPNHVFSINYFWKGVPHRIDAAMEYDDTHTLFWKWDPRYKMQYYLFNNKHRALLKKGTFSELYPICGRQS